MTSQAEQGMSSSIARMFLQEGTEHQLRDKPGRTAIDVAMANQRAQVVELLAGRAQPGECAVPDPPKAQLLHIPVLEPLKHDLESTNQRGSASLLEAVEAGDRNAVRILLAQGANTEETNWLSETALHRAAGKGYKMIVKELLTAGAEIEVADQEGLRPLHWASRGGHIETLKELLAAGADVEAADCHGLRPLHWAAKGGMMETVNGLLAGGAEIEGADSNVVRLFH